MTYKTYEESVAEGSPVLLFVFKYSGKTWRYTTEDNDRLYNTETFVATAISINEFPSVTDTEKATVEISVPTDCPAAELFKVGPPSEVVSVTVFSNHLSDSAQEFVVVWKGRVSNVDWDLNSAVITSDSVFNALNRAGLGPRFTRQCNTYVYSSRCKLAKSDWKQVGVVTSVSGTELIVPDVIGKEDNYFAGGYVEWENANNGNIEMRFIRSSYSATGKILLNSFALNMVAGQSVTLYPGCDHQLATCRSKFKNVVNYRGVPYIPSKNPFGGTALY